MAMRWTFAPFACGQCHCDGRAVSPEGKINNYILCGIPGNSLRGCQQIETAVQNHLVNCTCARYTDHQRHRFAFVSFCSCFYCSSSSFSRKTMIINSEQMEVDGASVHPSLHIINLLRGLQKPGTAFAECHKRWYPGEGNRIIIISCSQYSCT